MNYLKYKPEQISDIVTLYTQVFSDSEGAVEGKTIGNLVKEMFSDEGEHALECLVAIDETDKTLYGAIVLTELKLAPYFYAYILSPVAVKTSAQNKGIGSSLIKAGTELLKSKNVELLITYGDPNYYTRLGFDDISETDIKAPQPLSFPHGWLCQPLQNKPIPQSVKITSCISPLNQPDYW